MPNTAILRTDTTKVHPEGLPKKEGLFPPRNMGFLGWIPNILSLLRIGLTFLVGYRLLHHGGLLLTFVLAAFMVATDFLDGYLARQWGASSLLGRVLDPLGDKVMAIVLFGVLAMMGVIPTWLWALIMTRDACIVTGALLLWRKRHIFMAPLFISKLNTAVQSFFFLSYLLTRISHEAWRHAQTLGTLHALEAFAYPWLCWISLILGAMMVITTLASLFLYAYKVKKCMAP